MSASSAGTRSFVGRTLSGLLGAMDQALYAEEVAGRRGLLQGLDARVKVIGLLGCVFAAALSRQFSVLVALFGVALVLAMASRISLVALARREWVGVLLFTGVLALPAVVLTPGHAIARLPLLGWPITQQGLRAALYLILRVETAATFSLLLVLCTPWMQVLKALRALGVPALIVVLLGLTCRYIFLLLQIGYDMFEARQSRLIGKLEPAAQRRLAAATVGVLMEKTVHMSQEVYLAMQSRGFRGEVYTLDEFRLESRDVMALVGFMALIGTALWYGCR